MYESSKYFWLVTDYIRGGNLLERLREKERISEETGRRLIRNILKGVAHIHKHKIIHRDLKPENILMASIKNDTKIKIADFGVAAFAKMVVFGHCGTPFYAAPELLLGEKLTFKSDVYSIGIMAYMM